MTIGGNSLHQDRTFQNFGFNRNAFKLSGGAQKQIAETWHIGFGLGYERSWLDVSNLSSTNGHHVLGGVTVKARFGPTALPAVLPSGFDSPVHRQYAANNRELPGRALGCGAVYGNGQERQELWRDLPRRRDSQHQRNQRAGRLHGQFSNRTQSNGGLIKFSIPF
jgi:hypothetical protein